MRGMRARNADAYQRARGELTMSFFAWLPHMRSAPRAQHTSQRGEREGYEEATDLGDVNQ